MNETTKNILLGVIPALIVGVIVYFSSGVSDTYEAGESAQIANHPVIQKLVADVAEMKTNQAVMLSNQGNIVTGLNDLHSKLIQRAIDAD